MNFKKISTSKSLDIFWADTSTELALPFVKDSIWAGFPSPAEDYIDQSLDLNKLLIKHPSSTFFGRVNGNSLTGDGFNEGDLMIIDKSVQPRTGLTAVCYIDGDFTLKKIIVKKDGVYLMPANDEFKPIKIGEGNVFSVWGIVTYLIKKTF